MERTVNIHEAKTHLSRLLERVRRGESVTIAKAGQPIARLVPLGDAPGVRQVREPATGIDPATDRLRRFLEDEVWCRVPADQLGRRLSRDEEDTILGYGPEGV